MKPSYLWNRMIQKFSCKYCMHKYLNLSHFFPLQSCSSFSVVLVEELPTSESKSCSVHGDQLIKAVCCFLGQICLSRSKQNFKFSGLPCSHHHQQSPGFILRPCSLPSSASCSGWHRRKWQHLQRWRYKEVFSFSTCLSSSSFLSLSLNLSLSLILLSFRDHMLSDISILAVCSKSF